MCSTTTLYHVLISLAQSESPTAILNIGDMSYAGNAHVPTPCTLCSVWSLRATSSRTASTGYCAGAAGLRDHVHVAG